MNMTRNKRDPKKVALAQAIIDAYNPNSVEDMNDALGLYLNQCFKVK